MVPEQRQNLEKLCREYRIVFAKDVSEVNWPENHHAIFLDIQSLSQKKYYEYGEEQGSTAL
jgi:hypothetical protein